MSDPAAIARKIIGASGFGSSSTPAPTKKPTGYEAPSGQNIIEVPAGDGYVILYNTDTGTPIGTRYKAGGGSVSGSGSGGSSGGGSSSGGGVSGSVQAQLDWQMQKDDLDRKYQDAKDKADQANKDREYAIQIGDFRLAQQKADDANYWSGISSNLQQQQSQVSARGQDIGFAETQIRANQDKYDSDQRYAAAMAGAKNDADRNAITEKWNQEQAAIAKMDDETKRTLGGQQNQTSQFGAETTRAAELGRLGLDEQKYIMEQASMPRNLFNLFMGQRGVKPDWDTAVNGGTPASMRAIAPGSVLDIYKPTTAAPTFNGTPANAAADQVGAATGSVSLGANQFIGPSGAAAPTAVDAPKPWQPTTTTYAPPAHAAIDPTTTTPGRKPTTIDPNVPMNGDYGWDSANQGWVDTKHGNAPYVEPTKMADGGFTTDPLLMTGDANAPDPSAGGAVPEIIHNPTQAPLAITPNPENGPGKGSIRSIIAMMLDLLQNDEEGSGDQSTGPEEMGPVEAPRYALGTGLGDSFLRNPESPDGGMVPNPWSDQAVTKWAQRPGGGGMTSSATGYGGATPPDSAPGQMATQATQGTPEPGVISGPLPPTGYAPPQPLTAPTTYPVGGMTPAAPAAVGPQIGTDNSAAYANAGLGGAWIPSSANPGFNAQDAPARLRMLANLGIPIPPALMASALGQSAPVNNVGAEVGNRGLGALPSLQALNNMSGSERDMVGEGYYGGVGGIPWADVLDFIAKGTSKLKTANVAR